VGQTSTPTSRMAFNDMRASTTLWNPQKNGDIMENRQPTSFLFHAMSWRDPRTFMASILKPCRKTPKLGQGTDRRLVLKLWRLSAAIRAAREAKQNYAEAAVPIWLACNAS